MRNVLNATLVALLASSLQVTGCAEGNPPEPTTGGGGATTNPETGGGGRGGAGGTGGSDCVAEVCDGADNNCDGQIDEGCECLEGESENCYSGPLGTDDIGICKHGTRTCDPTTNKFGPCMGEVLPTGIELCDGLDQNCNGIADDGIPDLVCGVGACMATAPACVNGQPGTCMPGQPTQETCDGIDNDCDQLVDDAFPESGMACDSGSLGVCQAGTMQCLEGGVLKCVSNMMAGGELCDGVDNDCDGVVDNNIPGTGGACSTGAQGVCSAGAITCKNGEIDCFPVIDASPEKCDSLDNDCDGQNDEGNPEGGGACDSGQLGACAAGTLMCKNGGLTCQPNAQAQPELCDGMDNNCNGQNDEGNPGSGQACSCGGTTTCSNAQLVCVSCTKEVECNNNVDDDADGMTDCADPNCALGCNVNVQPCPAGQRLIVLSATDVPKTIVDVSTTTSTLTFTESGVVKRTVLQLNLTHTYDGDLDISLKSPSGTTTDVTSDNGVGGDNYTNTIFNDTCGNSIVNGSAPFSGCYTPEQPMSTFNDQPVKGTWSLILTDDAGGDSGSLASWTLAMCVQ